MDKIGIREKIFNAKKEIGQIAKDSTNPFFKSKYFDVNSLLQHVEPILDDHRLLLLQPIKDGYVFTQILDIDSDELVESGVALPQLTDPQKLGSAITYFRRYTLQSLLGLQAEDDDGNKAAKPAIKKLEVLDETHPKWDKAVAALKAGTVTIEQLKKSYHVKGKL
ncbi:Erf-like ssDNA annealing protein [Nonlabens phage P12024S]|uniref:Putative phage-associated recombination protein n=1 Tax=Nonlabens phage P12024S TaxID=1168478 RepID=I6R9L7_9CAUD|nr:Erf-like ssDNA annealing protein [Nonlabens phage P12024S]AFM54679.1 putative phage-associated recombination protein [Nonlabens phage P12024S]